MKLFHRHDDHADTDDAASDEIRSVRSADYDAQADLALPASDSYGPADDAFVPFGGELAPPAPGAAGYDVARDVGINPELA